MPATRALAAVAAAALLLVCASQPAAAAVKIGGETPKPAFQVVPGKLVMKMRPDFVSAMDTASHGLEYSRQATHAAVEYHITDGKSAEEKAAELADLPAVEYAEPVYRVSVNWHPNDSLFPVQWHHRSVASEVAWNATRGRQEVKVCHIDSGVRTDHPDLAGRVIKGWNMVPEVQDFDQEAPAAGTPQYLNINDTYGHGTHTAGIIAAVGDNMLGVAGVAMDVKLLVCRFIWDDGFGSIVDAIECLRLCAAEGALVSSNSWGGVPHSKLIEEGLREMEAAGMLFVVASGNQGIDLDAPGRAAFPASSGMPNMIVVGSSAQDDATSKFSNVGKKTVHLLAPGEQIMSTTYNNWYGPMDGTSMACPLVAGAAALLHSAALAHGVTLTYGEVRRLLLSTVDPCPAASQGASITGGRLNVGAAMAALALLLHERGQPELPGSWLEGDSAEALQRQLLENPWGQELLTGAGPALPKGGSGGEVSEGSLVARGEPPRPTDALQQLERPGAEAAAAGRVEAQSLPATAAAQQQARSAQRRKRKMLPAGR